MYVMYFKSIYTKIIFLFLTCSQFGRGGDGRAAGEQQRRQRAGQLAAAHLPAQGGRRRQPAAARHGEAQGM